MVLGSTFSFEICTKFCQKIPESGKLRDIWENGKSLKLNGLVMVKNIKRALWFSRSKVVALFAPHFLVDIPKVAGKLFEEVRYSMNGVGVLKVWMEPLSKPCQIDSQDRRKRGYPEVWK